MKKLHTFSFKERAQAGLVKNLLEAEGVSCILRNETLSAALGEIPFLECLPELWIVDDDVWPRAKTLLDNLLKEQISSSSWTCPECGEMHEGQFEACWKCNYGLDR